MRSVTSHLVASVVVGLCVLCGVGSRAYGEAVPQPLLHFPFDESGATTTADDIGTANQDGTLAGTVLDGAQWVAEGKYGGAFWPHNGATYVEVPAAALSVIDSQITVAFWVNDYGQQMAYTTAFHAAGADVDARILNCHLPYGWGTVTVYWDAGSDGSSYDRISKEVTNADDLLGWHHWAFVKDGSTGTMRIYLDGAVWLEGMGYYDKTMAGIQSFTLGQSHPSAASNYSFNGLMDDFRVYDVALTTEQVGLVMNNMTEYPVASIAAGADAAEPATDGTFTVTLSEAPSGTITVNYQVDTTVANAATEGDDYATLAGTVEVTGPATTATITIDVTDDAILETTETVALQLVGGTGYIVAAAPDDAASIALTDPNLPVVAISASDANAAEGTPADAGEYTIERTYLGAPVSAGALTVTYAVDASSTAAASDYVALSGTVTIPDGSATAVISLTPLDDTDSNEPDETVVVNVVAGAGYGVGASGSATVTISDDDVKPAAFALTSPADGDGAVGMLPTFVWEAAAVVGGSVDYRLEVATDGSFTSTVVDRTLADTLSYTATASEALTPGTTYYWRVTASNANGSTESDAAPFEFVADPSASATDWDGDGITNTDETLVYGTDPANADTDGDGMPDLWEIQNGLNPVVADEDDDEDGDGVSNGDEFSVGTDPLFNDLPGFGYSVQGCAPGGGVASLSPVPIVAALLVIMAFACARPRPGRVSWWAPCVAAAVLATACAPNAATSAWHERELPIGPYTRGIGDALPAYAQSGHASSYGQADEDFPDGWSPRGGLALYLGSEVMDARVFVGGYYHMLENDDRRVEVSLAVAPDTGHFGENEYFTVTGDYLGFIGEGGDFYWRAGGGGLLEVRGEEVGAFLVLQGGAGFWYKLGKNGVIYANASLQVPMGAGGEPAPPVVAIDVGYDY